MKCPYCGRPASLVTGKEIYPHRSDLNHLNFYQCKPCAAYVGTHKGTFKPLGRLANAELRKAKIAAHAAFDPIWRSNNMSRGAAYKWLANQLGMTRDECHIGMFDLDQCQKVIAVCRAARTKGY